MKNAQPVDPIAVYLSNVEQVASQVVDGKVDIADLLCSPATTELVRLLVCLRYKVMTERDIETVEPFLKVHDLSAWESDLQPAVLLVWDDIESESDLLAAMRECEAYSQMQPVFLESPCISGLIDWNAPPELIPINDLPWVDSHGAFVAANRQKWARPSMLLRDELVTYLRRLATTHEVTIRLDAYTLWPADRFSIQEAVMRAADPKWWRTLRIFPGEKKYSEYEVQEMGTMWEQVEYRRGLRRLEASFLRRNSGRLMGSVEELALENPALLTGLMLHCDSASMVGTDWNDGVLGHLDGAFNLYTARASLERLKQRHDGGKVVNASSRTHLFRINNVPIKIIIEIAQIFFRSMSLVEDWIHDQFDK